MWLWVRAQDRQGISDVGATMAQPSFEPWRRSGWMVSTAFFLQFARADGPSVFLGGGGQRRGASRTALAQLPTFHSSGLPGRAFAVNLSQLRVDRRPSFESGLTACRHGRTAWTTCRSGAATWCIGARDARARATGA